MVSSSGSFLWFPLKEKGVFRTTGDRGRNLFWGLWIPYGYLKFSDPLQNRRCLPLKPQNFYNRFKEKFCLQRVAPTGSVLAVVNLTKIPPEIFPYDAPDLKIDI